MQQHAADLVAGQQLPVAIAGLDGDAQTVAVGVGGENDLRADFIRQLDGKNERAGVFRVRHLDGGKIRVRQLLLLDDGDVADADFAQDAANRHVARTVDGRVDDGELAAFLGEQFRLDAQRLDLRNVVVIDFLVADDFQQPLRFGFFFIHQLAVGIGGRTDKRGDSVRGFRADLRAVFGVDLIAVVLRRIVTGGDDDAGDGVEVANRVGQNRDRAKRVKQIRRNALLRQHERRIAGKLSGEAAAVIRNYHAALRFLRILQQVLCQALRCPADVVAVHAVHACAQYAAHPRCAEGKLGIEAVFDFRGVIRNCLQIGNRIGIGGKIMQPLFISGLDVHRGTASLFFRVRSEKICGTRSVSCLYYTVLRPIFQGGRAKKTTVRREKTKISPQKPSFR